MCMDLNKFNFFGLINCEVIWFGYVVERGELEVFFLVGL